MSRAIEALFLCDEDIKKRYKYSFLIDLSGVFILSVYIMNFIIYISKVI